MEDTLKMKLFQAFPQLQSKVKKFNFQVSTTHFDKMKADLEQRANLQKKPEIQKKKQATFHPQNPAYKKLKAQAQQEFSHIEDDEIREKMISIWLQHEMGKSTK